MEIPTEHLASKPRVGPPSTLYKSIVFGVVALTLLLVALNVTLAVVALPEIARGLETSLVWVGWIITGYALVQAVVMPMAGRLSDMFGRKRLFLGALVLFILGSVGAGLSGHIVPLIIFRVLMAVGGGAFLPAAAGIVGDLFPTSRARMLGLFSSIFPIGAIVGPTFGGFLVQEFSWRWAFLVNVPVAGLTLVLAWVLLTEKRLPGTHRLDVRGMFLLSGGILSFMLSLTLLGGGYGLHPVAIWGMMAASPVLLLVFWRHERTISEPIVDLALLSMRPFFFTNAVNLVIGFFAFGLFSFLPLYTVTVYGFSTFESGAVLTGRGIAMIISSTLTSVFVLGRVSYRVPVAAGILVTALGFIPLGFTVPTISVFGVTISEFWFLFALLTIGGAGMGILNPPANNAGIELLPSKIAAITGLRGTFRSVGGVVSTSFIFFMVAVLPDQGAALQGIFLAFGLLLPFTVGLALMMPTGREASLESPPGSSQTA
ncbi:MAG: MFS transporter [Dehalococcoidia bacterium]